MSSFTTPLETDLSDDGCHWRLAIEFDYERGALHSGDIIRVPGGFITDFASVPQIFWNIFPPFGRYGKAAVLHDWLYAAQTFPKKEADLIFLEAMKALTVGRCTRTILYWAVKFGGAGAWENHVERGDPEKIKAGGLPEFPCVTFS